VQIEEPRLLFRLHQGLGELEQPFLEALARQREVKARRLGEEAGLEVHRQRRREEAAAEAGRGLTVLPPLELLDLVDEITIEILVLRGDAQDRGRDQEPAPQGPHV
jgi:hypothetical protein